jgi:hypothetical protein
MLIDEFIPEYEFRSHHAILVPAPGAIVRKAVEEWRPQESFLWRLLLRLRGLGRPQGTLRAWAEASGFLCLAETEDEVVYGQIGRFWARNERGALVSPRTADEFRRFDDPACAVAALTLLATEQDGGARTRLYTETRIHALGPQARRRFRLYWLIIRPFSGLLRRAMLNGIKARAIAMARPHSRPRQPERSV